MNRERAELVRRAREARADARARLQRLPDVAADVARDLARAHPWLATGGALTLGLLSSVSMVGARGSRSGRARSAGLRDLSSWALSSSALALRFLPGLLNAKAKATSERSRTEPSP